MSDYFSRLASRALEGTTLVRPDITPVFLGASAESVPDEPALELESTSMRERSRPPTNVEADPDDPVASHNGPEQRPHRAQAAAPPTAPQQSTARPRTRAASPTLRAPATASAVPAETRDSRVVQKIVTEYARPASLPQEMQAYVATPASEPPVVRISIGRIEVRAVSTPAAAQAPRAREAARSYLRSLDAYLGDRNRGKE